MHPTLYRLAFFLPLALAACDNFTPNPKTATYDPVSDMVQLPHPCPDWSQSQTLNVLNEQHSNFGCAVNSNSAVQLAYPQDLLQGHGGDGPDMGVSTHVIESYRAGTLPVVLQPAESTGVTQQ